MEDLDQKLQTEWGVIKESFNDVFRHREYVLGPEVELLENELANWLPSGYAIGCNSGFGAYLLSLLTLGIGRGKRVAVPAFAPAPYLGIIIRRGAIPVLVDVAPNDFHMSVAALAKVADQSLDAVVVHHLFGGAADMAAIMQVVGDVPTIEVLTYSLGARIGKDYAGTFGLLATSCLREETTIGAYGDAGMIWTSDFGLSEKLRRIRKEDSFGSMREDYVSANFHQDTVHAAVLFRKFAGWLQSVEVRRNKSALLAAAIAEQNINEIFVSDFYNRDATHFVVLAEKRDELANYLQSRGISATPWWPIPVYQQPGFRDLGYTMGDFPEAERVAAMSLRIPFLSMDELELDRLIHALVSFYRTGKRLARAV